MGLFPITIYTDSDHGGVPGGFRTVFQENRKPDVTWYATDVIIHSQTEIEFVVYGIEDNFYGGVGAEIYRVTAEVDKTVTEMAISRAALRRADRQLQEEARNAYLIKVNARALEILEQENIT